MRFHTGCHCQKPPTHEQANTQQDLILDIKKEIMPALNFQKQFAEAVKNGYKRQTIRSPRKNPIKIDDTLYLYTGMRTKNCEKLKEVTCSAIYDIKIKRYVCIIDQSPVFRLQSLDKIARADGFSDWAELARWFNKTHGLPFEGNLIYWT